MRDGKECPNPKIVAVTNHASVSTGRQAVKKLKHNPISTIFIVNMIIMLVVGLLAIYYVIQANVIASSNYKISLLSQELESLNEVHSSLIAQKTAIEDPAKVLDFALSYNMVEAKNAVYFFENGDMALRP